MATLTYGTPYRIQNGFTGWQENYLDTRGSGCQDNLYCVSTATSFDRDHGSGTWQILPAQDNRQTGDPVRNGDLIYLQNQFNGKGGYLDTRGSGCQDNNLCVSTADSPTRDGGSGTWRILTDSSTPTGEVPEDVVVHLWNAFVNWTGGFLDTRGSGCQGNNLCVSTSGTWDRETGSTHWQFHEQ